MKLRTILGSVALATVLIACGGAEDRKSAHMEKGQALFDAENFEKARLEFKNVLQIDPKDVPARFALAQTLEKLQNWRGAAGHYLGVLEVDPNHVESLSRMGQIYLLGRNNEKAKEHADRLLSLNPNDPDGLTLRAGVKSLNGDIDGALADAIAAVEAVPGHPNASALLASLYLRTGKADKSIETLESALAANPDNATIRSLLARVHLQSGNADKAATLYQEIVAQKPDELGHRIRLATFYTSQKQVNEAEEVLLAAVNDIGSTESHLAYAEFLAKNRSVKKAVDHLDTAINEAPADYRLRFAQGKLYEAASDLGGARKVYDGIIELVDEGPNLLTAKTRLAIVTAREGDRDGAKVLLAEVLEENARDQEALKLRGTILMGEGDATSAIADFRAALRDSPNSPELLRLLARAHLVNEEPELAKDNLLKGVEANPTDVNLRADLVNIYSREQDLDAAVTQLEEIIKVAPKNGKAYEGLFKVRVYQKDWVAAHDVANRMKTAFPSEPTGYYFDGLVYQGEKKLAESIEQFESALAVSPDSIQPLSQLIKSHVALGQQEVAEKRLAEVIELNDKNFVAHNLSGELHLASKRLDEASAAFNKAIELKKDWAIPYRNLASTLIAQEKNDEAVAAMEQGIEATNGAPLLVTGLASYLERTGNLDSAIDQYRKVLSDTPDSALATNNLAMLLIEYKDDEASRLEARDLAQKLEGSNNAAYLDTVGWVAFKFGENERAVEFLEKAVEISPDAAVMQFHLGMAYLAQGNEVSAKTHLERAVNANVEFRGLEEAKSALGKLSG
ncbi:MAG: tetratricopeptide repeat protein [Gammaproteobacteria bacterium]